MMAIYDTSTNELLEQYLMKINTDPTGQSLAIELKKKNPNGDNRTLVVQGNVNARTPAGKLIWSDQIGVSGGIMERRT